MNSSQADVLQQMNYPLYLILEGESKEEIISDDEIDHSQDDEDTPQVDEEGNEVPVDEEGNVIPPEPTEEEVFSYEVKGAEDKFIQFTLYEKLLDLSNKLEILQANVQLKDEKFDLVFTEKLNQYKQYVDVLNELIFTISTSTTYNIVGQLELELIALLEEYIIAHNETEEEKIEGVL